MEKGCKNHRETLYFSKGKIVYVVGKPCFPTSNTSNTAAANELFSESKTQTGQTQVYGEYTRSLIPKTKKSGQQSSFQTQCDEVGCY